MKPAPFIRGFIPPITPQNITLKTHSLGAGVASLVALHFHRLEKPINVFNSRSFSSITNFLVGTIRLKQDENGNAYGHRESIGGKLLGWLAKPFIKLGLVLAKWEMNAGEAFKNLPEAYRDYIVVRSRKNMRQNRIDDGVIPHYASIHKELTQERRDKKARVDESISVTRTAGDPRSKQYIAEALTSLSDARESLKSDRKMETTFATENGHNEDLNELTNRSGKTAQTFFREFVQNAERDHDRMARLQAN